MAREKKEDRLHVTVKNTTGYKRQALYGCRVNKAPVSAEVCRALSLVPDNNLICKESNCGSMWRACDSCISERTVSTQDTPIDRVTGLCFKHASQGDKNKSLKGSKKSRVKRQSSTLGTEKKKVTSLNEVLQQVMLTAEPPCDIMVDTIQRFAEQPRISFNHSSLVELGESLLVVQIMPIFIRRLSKEELKANGGRFPYALIDGERRWRACKTVHKMEIRAIILDVPNKATQFAISAIANFGREDHTPLEEALAIQFMREEFNLSVNEIASSYAKSVPWVYQRMKLLELAEDVQKMLLVNDEYKKPLKIGTAMLLSDLIKENPELQVKAAKHLVSHPDMTGKSAERFIHSLLEQEGIEPPTRRSYKIQGLVHTKSRLVSFVDQTWNKLDELLKIPVETYNSLPIDEETRRTLKNNLHSMSNRLEQLTKKF